jgi:hypothetical protein
VNYEKEDAIFLVASVTELQDSISSIFLIVLAFGGGGDETGSDIFYSR